MGIGRTFMRAKHEINSLHLPFLEKKIIFYLFELIVQRSKDKKKATKMKLGPTNWVFAVCKARKHTFMLF